MIGYQKEAKKSGVFNRIGDIILAVIVPVLIIVFWETGVKNGIINGNVVPAPSRLIKAFADLVSSGKLQQGLLVSFRRVLTGFFVASFIGIVIGFLMGIFRPFNQALSSLVNILRPIPTIALVPIFIIVLGLGEPANIAIIVVGAVWPILLNTTTGVLSVDRKLMELAYVYRIGKRKTLFRIILPSALTSIITGLRIGIGGAWMSVVAAEMIGASSGIGYMIMFAKSLAQAANMYVLVLVIGVIGFLIDRILLTFQKAVMKKFA